MGKNKWKSVSKIKSHLCKGGTIMHKVPISAVIRAVNVNPSILQNIPQKDRLQLIKKIMYAKL
tara:strand:- start:2572 stop:2760 length:189 start_codon:yes stop_codon:yes gene_type:complete